MNLLLYFNSYQEQTHLEAECMTLSLCSWAVVTEMLAQGKHTMGLLRAALPNESPIELTTHEFVVTIGWVFIINQD